ncbi:MAG: 2-isopropylmalate synthase [Planctomycetes bacterium]|nr:2-isopropylmalate synthase [Planctomycetota bacterium]MDA0946876.1 LeuA family protein [Planctomycetota bacterium]
MTAEDRELIHDWNQDPSPGFRVQLDDETLRDGLQSPSALDPSLDDKLALVHIMDSLGIDTANVGLPGASAKAREHILALCREMADLTITPNVACRTLVSDIAPAAEVAQQVGSPVEVCAFIGSSPIRMYAEGWEIEKMVALSKEAVSFATGEGLPCMFVTEDTTRAHPDHVRALYETAIEAGAKRICVCDTCGHVTPSGVRSLITFVRKIVEESGQEVGIDWHGHRDRGLGLANALAAIEAGATRIHGSAMGVGERTGNVEMDLLLVNLKLLGWFDGDLTALTDYVQLAARSVGVPLPPNYAVFGKDAFETSTGVHAAAVIKAFKKGDHWLANRVYSGVPADLFGLEQKIAVGPMSGKSNIVWVLERHGVEPSDDRIEKVLQAAKTSNRQLTDEEVVAAAAAS